MQYPLNITANNITYKNGDTLLVSFSDPFLNVTSINSLTFDLVPLDTELNGHDVQIRWSYDVAQIDRASGKPQISWSAWEDFIVNAVPNPNLQSVYDNILSKSSSFDLQIRFVRRGSEVGARRLDNLLLDITHHNNTDTTTDPQFPVNSSCKATSCVTPNFSSGITLKCDTDNLFRPYDVMGPGIQLWKDLSNSVSEMFGHCVRYFKTQPNIESADTVLKEYSLFNVTDVKDIKILLPDNEIPDNAIRFLPFDMDFGEGMEIHIVKEHFQRAFGFDFLPGEKDYLYFPLLDRMFEVQSAYLYKDFMAAEAYYKVMLWKWQDKENVSRDIPEIAEYIDNITEDFDEILQPETDKEYIDITKPQQYTTTLVAGYDKVRSHINDVLVIEAKDLTNYFTVVGKYFYDLKQKMSWGDLAVKYQLLVDRKSTENTAFTMWFKTTKTTYKNSPSEYDILLDGYNDTTNKGYRITLDYENISNSPIANKISVRINDNTYSFDIPALVPENWYGFVLNHMNDYSQLDLHIWEMKYNKNQPSQNKTTDLKILYNSHVNITPEDVIPGEYYELRAGNLGITNVRVWNESIEEEKQPILLNQYVVKDSRYALLIDNAIQPLRMVKSYVR